MGGSFKLFPQQVRLQHVHFLPPHTLTPLIPPPMDRPQHHAYSSHPSIPK